MHAVPANSTCRQVGTPEGLTLRAGPCMTAAPVLSADLVRGETVSFTNTYSKQTSRCGSPPEAGVKPLCWVQATVTKRNKKYTGFLPAVRGWEPGSGFTSAFCDVASPQEPLLLQPCGEPYSTGQAGWAVQSNLAGLVSFTCIRVSVYALRGGSHALLSYTKSFVCWRA
jgi:hypothetical protein